MNAKNSVYRPVPEHKKEHYFRMVQAQMLIPHIIKDARRAGPSGQNVRTHVWPPVCFSYS